MKLIDSILIALTAATFLIGVNEVISTPEWNIAENYWLFMLSFIFFITLRYVKQKRKKEDLEK